jgi:hypothetical protein
MNSFFKKKNVYMNSINIKSKVKIKKKNTSIN